MKKKVMTMVLAASMLLGMAGCGSSSANDSAAANGNTAGGDQAVAGTEKNDASGNAEGGSQEGTLTVWGCRCNEGSRKTVSERSSGCKY